MPSMPIALRVRTSPFLMLNAETPSTSERHNVTPSKVIAVAAIEGGCVPAEAPQEAESTGCRTEQDMVWQIAPRKTQRSATALGLKTVQLFMLSKAGSIELQGFRKRWSLEMQLLRLGARSLRK